MISRGNNNGVGRKNRPVIPADAGFDPALSILNRGETPLYPCVRDESEYVSPGPGVLQDPVR